LWSLHFQFRGPSVTTDPNRRATEIISGLGGEGDGNRTSAEDLFPVVYDELRRLAKGYMSRETPGHTLQPTALVHEAYLKLSDQDRTAWSGKPHVIGVAATAMRRILVNRTEATRRLRRGGAHRRVDLDEADRVARETDTELLEVDHALERLERVDERKARLVELRFFAGLSLAEAAEALEVSLPTAKRDWAIAKLFILREIERAREPRS
jgi:RNA polymerase sigma factor (TIGR02999 family)